MAFCGNCGFEVQEYDKFCPRCGVATRKDYFTGSSYKSTRKETYDGEIKKCPHCGEVLKSFENRKRILITPGIVELGNKSEEINKELGKKSTKCCDYIILVGAQQTVPIYNGIIEEGYPESHLYIAKNLQDALSQMNRIITPDSVVLLENDLPDNYL